MKEPIKGTGLLTNLTEAHLRDAMADAGQDEHFVSAVSALCVELAALRHTIERKTVKQKRSPRKPRTR